MKLNMADPDIKNVVADLHQQLKLAIRKKLEKKDWSEHEKEKFQRETFKVYKETVELALGENVTGKYKGKSTVAEVQQEMEPINKERAVEVNKLCAESEDLLTHTIRKRKQYPQKIKECLQKQHNAEISNLSGLDRKEPVENRIQGDNLEASSASNEGQFDMTECEAYLTRLKAASENFSMLSKSLQEMKDKAQRLHTATDMHLKMQDSDLHKALFNKRKLPSSFDSILATPTKDQNNGPSTESENTMETTWLSQGRPSKHLKGLRRKDTPNRT